MTRLGRRIWFLVLAAFLGAIAMVYAVRLTQIRSLLDAVKKLRDDGHLPPGIMAQVPPIAETLLGYRTTASGDSNELLVLRSDLTSRCYLARKIDRVSSLATLVVRYRSILDFLAEFAPRHGQAIDTTLQFSGGAVLTLQDTFVRHGLGAYDSASACSPESQDIVTWEWGAAHAELAFDSDMGANSALNVIGARGSQGWSTKDATTLVANDIILAFKSQRVRTTPYGPSVTSLRDPLLPGTQVSLPDKTPGDFAVSFRRYDAAGERSLTLEATGREILTTCSQTSNSKLLDIGLGDSCVLVLESASVIVLKALRNGRTIEISAMMYRSEIL